MIKEVKTKDLPEYVGWYIILDYANNKERFAARIDSVDRENYKLFYTEISGKNEGKRSRSTYHSDSEMKIEVYDEESCIIALTRQ